MDEFIQAVDDGMRLSKRVCYSKDRYVPPKISPGMDKSTTSSSAPENLQPTAPIVYAVIYDPEIVDNPDLPSYQPHVYGRTDPPALIPLQMIAIGLEVECSLDSAVVTMKGSWRVHCVMRSGACDCRLVVPMGEQGSFLDAEAEVSKQSYSTQYLNIDENEVVSTTRNEYGGFLKPYTFSLIIPKVSGGSIIELKASWVQKLLYKDDEFSIQIPFSFPEFTHPVVKVTLREKIKLNINTGTTMDVSCQAASHAFKEVSRQSGSLSVSYEADVLRWSSVDFHFSYTVDSSSLYGGLMLQSPTPSDFDQRAFFCLYIFSGNNKQKKVFRNNVVFVVDISKSMCGHPIESITLTLSKTISKLSPEDSFSIIAFNDEMSIFSSSLILATSENITDATEWMNNSFIASGGTNIIEPLDKAFDMLSDSINVVPHIFLITDGSVEDEKIICSSIITRLEKANKGTITPRISTFGLGLYCNHYFLRTLAMISRGQYDAAFDAESIDSKFQSLTEKAMSPLVVNITVEKFHDLHDALEVYHLPIPDILHGNPLIISGRCQGDALDSVKVKGVLSDMTDFSIEFKVQHTKEISLDRVSYRQHIDGLTAQAWLSDNKQLEEKVKNLSKSRNLASEYCNMAFCRKDETSLPLPQEVSLFQWLENFLECGDYSLRSCFPSFPDSHSLCIESRHNKKISDLPHICQGTKSRFLKHLRTEEYQPLLVEGLKIGFGDILSTAENHPTWFTNIKPPAKSAVFKKAIGCCSSLIDCCCCPCCMTMCSRMNNQCSIALTQLCGYAACLGCFACCSALCSNDN